MSILSLCIVTRAIAVVATFCRLLACVALSDLLTLSDAAPAVFTPAGSERCVRVREALAAEGEPALNWFKELFSSVLMLTSTCYPYSHTCFCRLRSSSGLLPCCHAAWTSVLAAAPAMLSDEGQPQAMGTQDVYRLVCCIPLTELALAFSPAAAGAT